MIRGTKKIFMAGIGGIGMSALARILKAQGKQVSGSDLAGSELVMRLREEGIGVKLQHKAENLPEDAELLIYSQAVPEDNPERQRAKELGIRELSYPAALGELLKDYYVIAVSGTNGKTTTAAMTAWLLEQAGLDPTALVGSEVLAWRSNARVGKSPSPLGKGEGYFVLEADEYKRGFLNYEPDIAVITNIAEDHLDYFKDLEDVQSAFLEFAQNIKPGGTLVYNSQDTNTASVARQYEGNKIEFRVKNYVLRVPGRYNQANAAAAAAVGKILGLDGIEIEQAFSKFTGTWRRFEKIGWVARTDIISDYAHHPDGLKVLFETAAEVYANKKILIVFQPHQHNRTKMLFHEFVDAFCEASIRDFIISEIFEVAGREESRDQDISSKDLVKAVEACGKNVIYGGDLTDTGKLVREKISQHDAVFFVGAGDIYLVAERMVR